MSQRLSRAEAFLAKRGESILKDKIFLALAEEFISSHKRTLASFETSGVFEFCKSCGNGPKGGCCLYEAGDWYEVHGLALNMLLGVKMRPNLGGEYCPFLGEGGCILIYRDQFCINFFCEELFSLLGKREIQRLRAVAGKEILAGIRLESYLKRFGD